MEKAPRPLLDGDDRNAVKAGKSLHVFLTALSTNIQYNKGNVWLVYSCKLTAAFLEDNGAAEIEEPLSIETRSVN